MLVMLAYETPEQKDQTFLRKEFERTVAIGCNTASTFLRGSRTSASG